MSASARSSVPALVLLLAVAAVLASASGAVAQASPAGTGDDPFDCSAAVVDTSGQLDVDDVAAVAATIEDATVVVRGFDSVPGGDLAARVDDLIAECFGEVATTDLALLSFSVEDRASDVFLGSALPGSSTSNELAQAMSGPFPDGQFTEGVLIGLDRLATEVEGSVAAVDDDPRSDVAPDDEGSGVLPWLLGAGVVTVGAGAGGALLVDRRRKLTARRNELAAATIEPRSRVGALREHGLRLEGQAELWSKTSAGKTLSVLHDLRNGARTAAGATESAAALLSQATPDGIESASDAQIALARTRLDELAAALDVNQRALDELLAFGAHLDHLRVALLAKKQLLTEELAAADRLAAERRDEGWVVDEPVAELSRARAAVSRVELGELALDLLALSDQLEGAEAQLFAADHDLQSLPDRPGAIATWRARQLEAVESEERRSVEADQRVAGLESIHSPESWHWAAQYPERARSHLAKTVTIGAEAEPLASAQRFDDAGRVLERAGLELIAADQLLDEVDDLLIDLQQAKIEGPGILAESRQVLGQFASFVERHRGDLDDSIRRRPEDLDATIDGLEAELASRRPNYLHVAEAAEQINRELDELLASATEQHERMEALRRQAGREVARAQRNVRRARQALGWELFESRDGRMIDELEAALTRLPQDPAARLAQATDIADDAVHVQERIIARRRRNSNWVIVSGGGGGGTTSSGGFGGSIGGGGGGGGISLGGGGGGAGRSFGGGRSTIGW